jgi:hypothetical protein
MSHGRSLIHVRLALPSNRHRAWRSTLYTASVSSNDIQRHADQRALRWPLPDDGGREIRSPRPICGGIPGDACFLFATGQLRTSEGRRVQSGASQELPIVEGSESEHTFGVHATDCSRRGYLPTGALWSAETSRRRCPSPYEYGRSS